MSADAAAIGAEAQAQQRRAADPAVSAWVEASAGTGKTKLLTDRVLALLLAGAEPARILCLTFTKAAAAEMATRLAGRLGDWPTMAEAKLATEIAALLGRAPDAAILARAQSLFARVLDLPGGMRIMTIHAFCQSLLRRFPLESRLSPHFALVDELAAAALMREAREAVLARHAGGAGAIDAATANLARLVNAEDFAALVRLLQQERGRLEAALVAHGGIAGVVAAQRAALGLGAGETEQGIIAAACADAACDIAALRRAAATLARSSGKTDQGNAARLGDWLAAEPARRAETWAGHAGLFLTQAGEVRAERSLASKAAETKAPGTLAAMQAEAARVLAVAERIKAARLAEASGAILVVGAAIDAEYAARKAARGLLDSDDLIHAARGLLEQRGVAPWVLYKLDGGIDHVLIDEAQDTNPDQWRVIQALTGEFFAGEGARSVAPARTIFAVGDVKQSIYGFQRADPKAFGAMRAHYQGSVTAAGAAFRAVPLAVSFRSTAPVLDLVDAVFADPERRRGVALDGGAIAHTPHRVGAAGRVELWPFARPDARIVPEPWALPAEQQRARGAAAKLAGAIAARVAAWCRAAGPAEDGWLPARGRATRPGDVLVLVRRRDTLMLEIVRALKSAGIAVAGIDRMVLTEQIAVMDLMAFGDVLLLPEDDLSLAALLRSPLLGLSEQSLMDLAAGRAEPRLRDVLEARAAERAEWAEAAAFLRHWAARADFASPYALYAELLASGRPSLRERLLERLGPDAADPIDEFLAAALSYERTEPPSLQGFLHWLRAGGAEIKREAEAAGGAVRVMTVHGAKGLQAPVVVLPDTTQPPRPQELPRILWQPVAAQPGQEHGQGRGQVAVPLYAPRAAWAEARFTALKQAAATAQDEEYRRLLYVALTRTADRLVVCGAVKAREPAGGSWYRLVADGFAALEKTYPLARSEQVLLPAGAAGAEDWAGEVLSHMCAQTAAPDPDRAAAAPAALAAEAALAALPDWATRPPAAEERPPRPLTPSRAEEDEVPAAVPVGLADPAGQRFRRGLLVHRLLERLPALPAAERAEAARRFLARPGHGLDAAAQAEILAEVLAVMDHPGWAPLFAPEALAEAPLIGLAGGRVIAGQVDRLLVRPEAVLVLDFKTNRPPPGTVAEVAPAYVRQMAAYRAVLRRLYPDRPVRCALLWTYGPRLMQLPDELLDSHAPDA
ncbi:MAG: double-strand break repair helicase AddA [Alphaproteobacteria bacterium]|nr:double-strand break repair helicase AddA [Alphaproteobacteria bacterium]